MSRTVLAALAVAALAVGPGVALSGADFTASSPSPANTFATAADFNGVAVALADPGAAVQGTVALSATASSDRGITAVRIRRAPAGTTSWTVICEAAACAWNTTGVADGLYDLQVEATDSAGYTRTATVAGRRVDNTAPAVALANPGANVGGTVGLTATASDAGSGVVTQVRFQRRPQGETAWETICTDTGAPWACSFATTAVADGMHELRAVARDGVGRETATSATTVRVDNTPAVTANSAPATGRGDVHMTATASDPESGIAYVGWEALYAGSWYEFCHDTQAPYTCSGPSSGIADGEYQVRTVTVNGAGVRRYGDTWTIRIDNTAPVASDVQAVNGGVAGRLDAGDRLRLTWSDAIAPASIVAGWNGQERAIRVRVQAANDALDVLDTNGATRLPVVLSATDLRLGADFVTADADFQATMALTGGVLTVTLGTLDSGTPATVAAAGTMTWRPAAQATDLAGNPSSTTQRSETGAADVDF